MKAFAAIGLTAALFACSSPNGDSGVSSADRITNKSFDKDHVMEDADLVDTKALGADAIQSFLDDRGSALAQYEEGGNKASQILYDAATENGVNPLVLLVRVQMERSLVSKTPEKATDRDYQIAFGCVCPESSACSPAYEGFTAQAGCAARTIRRAMTALKSGKATAGGWSKGETKTTQDGVDVTPDNNATAALYNYTPYVGEGGGGASGIGGVYLHAQLWTQYAAALGVKTSGSSSSTSGSSGGGAGGGGGSAFGDDAGASSGDDAADPGAGDDAGDPGTGDDADVDAGTGDDASDLNYCVSDSDCGDTSSGSVCDPYGLCVQGCRGADGNGCPSGYQCTSSGTQIGMCIPGSGGGGSTPPADAGTKDSGTTSDGGTTGTTSGDGGAKGSSGSGSNNNSQTQETEDTSGSSHSTPSSNSDSPTGTGSHGWEGQSAPDPTGGSGGGSGKGQGCAAAPTGGSDGAGWLALGPLAFAAATVRRRRRRNAA